MLAPACSKLQLLFCFCLEQRKVISPPLNPLMKVGINRYHDRAMLRYEALREKSEPNLYAFNNLGLGEENHISCCKLASNKCEGLIHANTDSCRETKTKKLDKSIRKPGATFLKVRQFQRWKTTNLTIPSRRTSKNPLPHTCIHSCAHLPNTPPPQNLNHQMEQNE